MRSDKAGFQSYGDYTSGVYWEEHRDVDSSYKVELLNVFLEKLEEQRNFLLPKSLKLAEIGCGTGAFLFPLAESLTKKGFEFECVGYDISDLAINIANSRNISSESRLTFFTGSAEDLPSGFDIIYVIDVLEHLENPFSFLQNLYGKSKYLIVHLPIEQSVVHLLAKTPISSHQLYRHIHFFSWESAKILIQESPYNLMDFQFGSSCDRILTMDGSFVVNLFRRIKYFMYKFIPNLAPIIGGGSVLILLEPKNLGVTH